MEVREITYAVVGLRIMAALLLGGILGLERGLKNRPAGLRTYMLVCVGACLIMLINQYTYQVFGVGDPVRMGSQVVSGIGFLGAGTIIVTRRSQIKGLTTAAGLWTAAAVGLAVGIGFYEAAFLGGIIIFVVLTLLHKLDSWMHKTARYLELYVELSPAVGLTEFLKPVRELGVQIEEIQADLGNTTPGSVRVFVMSAKLQKRINHDVLLDQIRCMEGVMAAETL